MRGLLAVVMATAFVAAASADEPRTDSGRIQGSWLLISSESDGQPALPESIRARGIVMVFEENQVIARMGEMTVSLGTFTLDETQAPRGYDRVYTDGSLRRGIYKLEEDRLTICIAALGKDRPTAFTTKPGDGQSLLVYTREKP